MADASITLTVLRGSVPSACYVDGGEVSAAIVLVAGLTTLDLTVTEIEVGTGDTDAVTFSYDDSTVPSGVTLSECNFSSFQCVCDCCAEKRCFEVVGPDDDVVDGIFNVGFMPGQIQLDQIRVYSPGPSATNFNFRLYADGLPVIESTATTGSPTVINRVAFTSAFSGGVIDVDAELTIIFNGAPVGAQVWSGFQLCLLGRWMSGLSTNNSGSGGASMGEINSIILLSSVTGYIGGGATNLDGVTTVGLEINTMVRFRHATDGWKFYVLRSGSNAESSPAIVRPDDYDGVTNVVYWEEAV